MEPIRIGEVLQDTYVIERAIGSGGVGMVFEAAHQRLSRRFAVKVLLPKVATDAEAVARLRREAELTSRLGHPHIIEIVDFNHTPGGAPYIVMELLQGEDLQTRLRREGALPLPLVSRVLDHACSALQAAHDQEIIHRDLKPQNIYLCQVGRESDYVKILDFGMSKIHGLPSMLTGPDMIVGTPLYMSPEQAQGASTVDRHTDVFAMGAILYEMLSGKQAFAGDTVVEVLRKVTRESPTPLEQLRPGLSPPVLRVVEQALAKRRDDRFDTVLALAEAFARAVEPARPPGDSMEATLPPDSADAPKPQPPAVDPLGATALGLGPEVPTGPGSRPPTGPVATRPGMGPPGPPVDGTAPARLGPGPASVELATTEPGPVSVELAATALEPASSNRPTEPHEAVDELDSLKTLPFQSGQDQPAVQTVNLSAPGAPSRSRVTLVALAGVAVGALAIWGYLALSGPKPATTAAAPDLASRPHDAAPRPADLRSRPADLRTHAADSGVAPALAEQSPEGGGAAATRPLWVRSRPAGARVSANGRPVGMTPLAGQPIPSRATTLRLSKPGFLAHRRRLPAGQGAVRLKTVVLQPKPRAQRPPPAATVRLRVAAAYNGDPVRNAPVLVNGKAWGKTPLQRDVEPGTYKVRVVAAGYRPAEKRVRVAAGKKTVLVILDLTR